MHSALDEDREGRNCTEVIGQEPLIGYSAESSPWSFKVGIFVHLDEEIEGQANYMSFAQGHKAGEGQEQEGFKLESIWFLDTLLILLTSTAGELSGGTAIPYTVFIYFSAREGISSHRSLLWETLLTA